MGTTRAPGATRAPGWRCGPGQRQGGDGHGRGTGHSPRGASGVPPGCPPAVPVAAAAGPRPRSRRDTRPRPRNGTGVRLPAPPRGEPRACPRGWLRSPPRRPRGGPVPPGVTSPLALGRSGEPRVVELWVQPLPAVPGVCQGSPRWPCGGWGPLLLALGSPGWLGPSGVGCSPFPARPRRELGVPRLFLETPGWLPPKWDPRCPHDGRRVPSPAQPLPRGPEVAGAAGLGPGVSPSRLGKPRLGREMIPVPAPLCFPAPWPPAGRSPRHPRGVPEPQASPRSPPGRPKDLALGAHVAGVGFSPVLRLLLVTRPPNVVCDRGGLCPELSLAPPGVGWAAAATCPQLARGHRGRQGHPHVFRLLGAPKCQGGRTGRGGEARVGSPVCPRQHWWAEGTQRPRAEGTQRPWGHPDCTG